MPSRFRQPPSVAGERNKTRSLENQQLILSERFATPRLHGAQHGEKRPVPMSFHVIVLRLHHIRHAHGPTLASANLQTSPIILAITAEWA
ncbi:hypothetical protein BL470_005311 [Escherichia coli]|nr:hypothetical protein [Escherichia coli]EFG9941219.1 hypothetical protein [Escherichia coli]